MTIITHHVSRFTFHVPRFTLRSATCWLVSHCGGFRGTWVAVALQERLLAIAAVVSIAYGPDIGAGDSRYSVELVVACAGVGPGDDVPLRAVPVLNGVLGTP